MLYREENNYLAIARRIADEGYVVPAHETRTGIGSRKVHVVHMDFDLRDGKIPILSTRKVNPRAAIVEMCWFVSGSTDIEFLKKHNVSIWDSWVIPETAVYDEDIDIGIRELEKAGVIKFGEHMQSKQARAEFMLKHGNGKVSQMLAELTGKVMPQRKLLGGSIGPGAYGAGWRRWEDIRVVEREDTKEFEKLTALGYSEVTYDLFKFNFFDDETKYAIMRKEHDQLQTAIDRIINNPFDRRIIVTPWNPGKLDQAVLPPCHSFFQFLPFEKNGIKYLDLALTCRSQDFLVGTVFNVLQYGVLCQVVAKLTGREANRLYWTGNDTHIYDNQLELFNDVHRDRDPMSNHICLEIDSSLKTLADFTPDKFTVRDYKEYYEPITYPVAV